MLFAATTVAAKVALCVAFTVATVVRSSAPTENFPGTTDFQRPGGQALTFATPSVAGRLLDVAGHFLATDQRLVRGREAFHRDWLEPHTDVAAPAAGPDFDASRCSACHAETATSASPTAFPWIAKPIAGPHHAKYGPQVTTRHSAASSAEAAVITRFDLSDFVYPDGQVRRLKRPLGIAQTRHGETIAVALRTAPLLFGWGLIERVDRAMLPPYHDPRDRDGDGISGRMRQVDGDLAFMGWKNAHSSLRAQIATALTNDMGVRARSDDGGEIDAATLDALDWYVANLGVPERRAIPQTGRGRELFGEAGCAACHVPALITAKHHDEQFSEQLIWPFTDLMLHDMGPDLAEPGGDALAAEWRTAPLWGLGVVEERFPERGFLHDGRAASLEEAILWHGGEARAARDAFAQLSARRRAELLAYVRSL